MVFRKFKKTWGAILELHETIVNKLMTTCLMKEKKKTKMKKHDKNLSPRP